jgi:hypothetical protein
MTVFLDAIALYAPWSGWYRVGPIEAVQPAAHRAFLASQKPRDFRVLFRLLALGASAAP